MTKRNEALIFSGITSLAALTGLYGPGSAEAVTRSKIKTTRTTKDLGRTVMPKMRIRISSGGQLSKNDLLEIQLINSALEKGIIDHIHPNSPKSTIKTSLGPVAVSSTLYEDVKHNGSEKLIFDSFKTDRTANEPEDSIKIKIEQGCYNTPTGVTVTSALGIGVTNGSKNPVVYKLSTALKPNDPREAVILPTLLGDVDNQFIDLSGVSGAARIPYDITVTMKSGSSVHRTGELQACTEVMNQAHINLLNIRAAVYDAANNYFVPYN